ncbi:MAG: response regulator [Myxococcales bacterium]|nr:response regulator [Myxococcales bacterium]
MSPNDAKGADSATVVIADDDPEILKVIRNLMHRRGFKIHEAADGDEAMRLILEQEPDLVILDVMMPGQTGWEVCRSVRESDSLEGTGVIMLTGIGERMNELTSPLYGADRYLDKPFEFDDLDTAVTEVLEKRRPPQ